MVFGDCINEHLKHRSEKVRYADFENMAQFNVIKTLYSAQFKSHESSDLRRKDLEEFDKIFLIPKNSEYKETGPVMAFQSLKGLYLTEAMPNTNSEKWSSYNNQIKILGKMPPLVLEPFHFNKMNPSNPQRRYKHIQKKGIPMASSIRSTEPFPVNTEATTTVLSSERNRQGLQTRIGVSDPNSSHLKTQKYNTCSGKPEPKGDIPFSHALEGTDENFDHIELDKKPQKPPKILHKKPKISNYIKNILEEQFPPLWSENEWKAFVASTEMKIESLLRKKKTFEAPLSKITPSKNGCARMDGYLSHIKNKVWNGENGIKTQDSIIQPFTLVCEANSTERDVSKNFLFVARSSIHFWGLFTSYKIHQDELIIYYQGELISNRIAHLREQHYVQSGIGSSYLFRCDDNYVVDATKRGNIARFMNHSCDPNSYAIIMEGESGRSKIGIYALRQIDPWQEITYDYKFPIEEFDKILCHCRTLVCRGYLN